MRLFIISLFVCCSIYVRDASAQDSQSVDNPGKMLYEQTCLACHQADGGGVPGLAPPLIEGVFVNGDRDRLINILLEGLEGVEIKGETYANPMPAFDYLSDEDIANVLTYVRSNFDNKKEAISKQEVTSVRAAK